jgi:two-component system, OmpR family, sensor histidine kinase ArlS
MKIRTKLILNYSLLSVILLFLFSIIVVLLYIKYRQDNFESRLHNRAASSANFVLNKIAIDSAMLSFIDRNIVTTMDDLQIVIYDENKDIVYSNTTFSNQTSKKLDKSSDSPIGWFLGSGFTRISFTYFKQGHNYDIVASAFDSYGLKELLNLLYILAYVMVFSIIIIACFGFYSAIWSLKPFKKIIKEVEQINPTLIKKRISVRGNDEISQLAKSFNRLLDRIEEAFETEKSFISNASHELRTPVTSILGQIEVVLNKGRTEKEYKALLQSVYEDTSKMATIINGFLDLAETNLENIQVSINTVRIDELLFSILDDFEKKKPEYIISIDFISDPEVHTQLECNANARLLALMFNNLIDNACKYSIDNKARVTIGFSATTIIVSIVDHGIGIPSKDFANIFKPLFRGSNTSGKSGHGLGLAIVKKIADFHNASIDVKSTENLGTEITVTIKK